MLSLQLTDAGGNHTLSGPDLDVDYSLKFTGPDEGFWQSGWFRPGAEGAGLDCRVAEGEEHVLLTSWGTPTTGQWHIIVCCGGDERPIPLPAPAFSDRTFDFGVVKVPLGDAVTVERWVIAGTMRHSSGAVAASNSQFYLYLEFPDVEVHCRTDEAGRFAHFMDDAKPSQPGRCRLLFDDGETVAADSLKPVCDGRLWFFDIVLECGLLELGVSGLMSQAERMKRGRTEDADHLTESYVQFEIESFVHSTLVDFDPYGKPPTRFLPPGPYSYVAECNDRYAAYLELRGEFQLAHGGVHRLELAFKPAPHVLVWVTTPEGAPSDIIKYEAVWIRGKSSSSLRGTTNTLPLLFAHQPGYSLEVSVRSGAYKPVRMTVPPDAGELTVALAEKMPNPPGKLRIRYPTTPKGMDARLLETVARRCDDPKVHRRLGRSIPVGNDTERTAEYELDAGAWRISIVESGTSWGYRDGIASGPVEATIEAGKAVEITMPDFAPPPWLLASDTGTAALTCAGKPFSYSGPGRARGDATDLFLYYGGAFRLQSTSLALLDGVDEIALDAAAPTKADPKVRFSKDLECRIEVRLRRNGVATDERFDVQADSGEAKAWSQSADGSPVFLWLPPGKAKVALKSEPMDHREIEVKRGERVVVEFDSHKSVLKLAWDNKYQQTAGVSWMVLDAGGQTVAIVSAGHPSLALPPGDYRLRPLTPTVTGADDIRFQLGGRGQTLPIPFVAAVQTATLHLPYPKDLKPDPRGYYFQFDWFCPALGDMEYAQPQSHNLTNEFSSFLSADGVTITGLPAGVEIVVMAAVANLRADVDGEDSEYVMSEFPVNKGWAMNPRVLKLKAGQTNKLDNVWDEGAVLDYTWIGSSAVFIPNPQSHGIRYRLPDWMVLPVGPYTLTLNQPGEEEKMMAIRLEATGAFIPLPKD